MNKVTTPRSLETFLEGILDFAGLFPPAALSLEEALRHFETYQSHPSCAMVARFVLASSRIQGAEAYFRENASSNNLKFSVVFPPKKSSSETVAGLDACLEAWKNFALQYVNRGFCVDSMEMPLPAELLEATESHSLANFLKSLSSRLKLLPFFPTIYLELPWNRDVAGVMECLSRLKDELALPLALKIRTGGLTPELIPPPEKILAFMQAAHGVRMPFKATAGLHDAVRHFDKNVGAPLFGFYNIFVAAMLAHEIGFDHPDVLRALVSENTRDFDFRENSLVVLRAHTLSSEKISELRRTQVQSFGSCSFEEPLDSMRAAGHLYNIKNI